MVGILPHTFASSVHFLCVSPHVLNYIIPKLIPNVICSYLVLYTLLYFNCASVLANFFGIAHTPLHWTSHTLPPNYHLYKYTISHVSPSPSTACNCQPACHPSTSHSPSLPSPSSLFFCCFICPSPRPFPGPQNGLRCA